MRKITVNSTQSSAERRLKAHLKSAEAYANLSHAKRLKVGAVLIKDDRIVSIGYNGMPSGGSNQCEEPVYDLDLLDQVKSVRWVTKPEVIHAEMNAIAFAAKSGVSTDGCTMVVTHSPCFECSKLLFQSGIKKVYYRDEYRLTDSLEFLRQYNVKVEKIDDKEQGR